MAAPQSTASLWVGRVVSALVVLFLAFDGAQGLFAPQALAEPMAQTGFPIAMLAPVSIAAWIAAIVYAIPHTAVLGAILVTAFCGGAIATHVRVGQIGAPEQIICLVLGVAAWAGLWLRDARVRALLPVSDRSAKI